MRILKTSDYIPNEIIQCDEIQIFNYVSGKQTKELCEAVANVICDGNTYAIKMSKEERENLPYLSGMKVSREIHIDPLVTCGECKHKPIKHDPEGDDFGFNLVSPNGYDNLCPCLNTDDGFYSYMPEDNFFCAYGERRTDE